MSWAGCLVPPDDTGPWEGTKREGLGATQTELKASLKHPRGSVEDTDGDSVFE